MENTSFALNLCNREFMISDTRGVRKHRRSRDKKLKFGLGIVQLNQRAYQQEGQLPIHATSSDSPQRHLAVSEGQMKKRPEFIIGAHDLHTINAS